MKKIALLSCHFLLSKVWSPAFRRNWLICKDFRLKAGLRTLKILLPVFLVFAASGFAQMPEPRSTPAPSIVSGGNSEPILTLPPATGKRAVITDAGQLYSTINTEDCLDWKWTNAEVRRLSGSKGWGSFYPKNGDEGEIVYETKHCSSGVKIYILKIGKYYAPLGESGVRIISSGSGTGTGRRATITAVGKIYPTINTTNCLDWTWATPAQKGLSGTNGWKNFYPRDGDEGEVVFETMHCDKVTKVYIVKIRSYYVPIGAEGVRLAGGSVSGRGTITAVGKIYPTINQTDCLDWTWATPAQKNLSGSSGWGSFYPRDGDVGEVIFETMHCDGKTKIYILKVGSYFVPIGSQGLRLGGGGSLSSEIGKRATITDVGQTYGAINTIDCIDWQWATPEQKRLSGKSGWDFFYPRNGDTGEIVSVSKHCNSDVRVYILKIGNYYVPIGASGIRIN